MKDKTDIINTIDNYLIEITETPEIRQIKTIIKQAYSRIMMANKQDRIQYYSSLIGLASSGKNLNKVKALLNIKE